MIWLACISVGLLCLAAGFVLGTAYGVRREYETNQKALYQLERWRRNRVFD